jgi:predicted helicase
MNTKFWSENLKGSDHLEDLDIDGRKIDLKEIQCEGVDWTNLAQSMVQWLLIMNTVMKFRVHKRRVIS